MSVLQVVAWVVGGAVLALFAVYFLALVLFVLAEVGKVAERILGWMDRLPGMR